MLILTTLVLTTLICSTAQSDGQGFFIAFTVLYGIFASAYVSLFPTSLVELWRAALCQCQRRSVHGG